MHNNFNKLIVGPKIIKHLDKNAIIVLKFFYQA